MTIIRSTWDQFRYVLCFEDRDPDLRGINTLWGDGVSGRSGM
jgi:hypothetical protein